MKIRASIAAVVAAAGLVVAVPQAHADSLTYVALGDSYSAGSGNFPLSPGVLPFCAQSTKDFGHLIAASTAADFTDVSCGGAQTKDFTASQYPGLAPQLDAVDADTDLITMTIGGNDAQLLASAAGACGSAAVVTFGTGSPCKTIYGSTFDKRVDTKVYPAVRQALLAVRAKAPNARVAVVGYPWIMPATRGCYPLLPIARGDIPYMRALEAHLNAVIAQAADETGATFVDMAAASNGHDSCAARADRWVEPILGASSFALIHANEVGEAKMAERTMAVLGLG